MCQNQSDRCRKRWLESLRSEHFQPMCNLPHPARRFSMDNPDHRMELYNSQLGTEKFLACLRTRTSDRTEGVRLNGNDISRALPPLL